MVLELFCFKGENSVVIREKNIQGSTLYLKVVCYISLCDL